MNKEYPYHFSVVVPVYNSQASLKELLAQCSSALEKHHVQYILVNDASHDKSWDVINELKNTYENLIGVNFEKNAGQHAAIFCGMQFAKGEYIVTIDDDLQVAPSEILKLHDCALKEEADVVYGIYPQKKHNAVRNTGSKFVGLMLHQFASTPQIGSSFKLIHQDVVADVVKHMHQNIYIDELIAWHTKKTAFTEVEHSERVQGKSGYSPCRLLKMTAHLFLNYTALPLKFITYLGVISSLASFGIGIYYLFIKMNTDVPVELGFTSLIVAIFFSTGLILLSLGIIGEYLSKIFLLQTGKPPYKIKSIIK